MTATLYHGPDAWRLHHAARVAADNWSVEHGHAVLRLDGTHPETPALMEQLVRYPSFFQTRSCALVTGPLAVAGLPELLKNLPADIDLILVEHTAPKPLVAVKQALTSLTKLCDTTELFTPLTGAPLAAWVRTYCQERGRSIEPAAVAELTGRVGEDSWALAGELEKVCAYEPQTVTVATVRLLVPLPAKQDEWELSNALSARDRRGAVAALFRRLNDGAPEQLLAGTIASAFRTLLMVRDLSDRGQPAAGIAKSTGLHPYVVSKTLRGAAAYEPEKLRAAHRALAALDRASKEGRADMIDGLFSILIAL